MRTVPNADESPHAAPRGRIVGWGEAHDPLWNMALDEVLLDQGPHSPPTLRFYRWRYPALSIGYFQEVRSVVRRRLGSWDEALFVVRRITGGGRVRHGQDLTVSLVLPVRNPYVPSGAAESYHAIHRVFFEGLKKHFDDLRIACSEVEQRPRAQSDCFEEAVSGDLISHGKKILGSSQRRRGNTLLHQTSMRISFDPYPLMTDIVRALEEQWGIFFHVFHLSEEEIMRTQALIREKYSGPEFSYSPQTEKISICS